MPAIVLGVLSAIYGFSYLSFSSFDEVQFAWFLIAGFCFSMQRKICWFIALFLLFGVFISNVFYASILAAQLQSYEYQLWLALSVLLAITLIFSYFRFPYLDGRDTAWFGVANRMEVSIPAILGSKQNGKVTSISITGVLFHFAESLENIRVGDQLHLTMEELNLHELPVEVRGMLGEKIRLKFLWLGFAQSRLLKSRLKKMTQTAKKS